MDSRRLMCGHLLCARMLDKTRGLSDASGFEPDDDGSEDDQRAIVGGALLVAGGEPTPLFKSIDAAFDDVATGIDRLVEGQRPTRPTGALRPLITTLRNGVWDVPPSEQLATARVTIPFVGDEPLRSRTRASTTTNPWHTNAVQDRRQLGTVMSLAGRDDNRERSSLAVAGQMHLARQPAAAAPESLVGEVADPFFSSARLGRRRAPLACWWARAVVLSMLTSQTTSPTASERVCACASIRSQVPSRRQR